MYYADALEPDERINRRETSYGDRRVEEKLGVKVQRVGLVDHGHAIDLECQIECLKDAWRHKRVGRGAIGIVEANQDPERKHERLSAAEGDVQMAGRAVARSVGNREEHDMGLDNGIAIAINRDSEFADGPALINLIPTGKGCPECMRVSGYSCKYRRCQAQAKQGGREAWFDHF